MEQSTHLYPIPWHIWVFPKRISLNSANSVNHDKIHKCYGYQRYYLASNKYIAIAGNRKYISHHYLQVDIHCDSPEWKETIPETVMKISFLQLHLGMYLLSDMECLWYYFWILSWFTEFSESHSGTTLVRNDFNCIELLLLTRRGPCDGQRNINFYNPFSLPNVYTLSLLNILVWISS